MAMVSPDANQQKSRTHILALDGVRGLAVLLVLLMHFTPSLSHHSFIGNAYLAFCRTGWCGVNLFFVLSGFLITGILTDDKGSPNYLRNFYARRVLRIFPLYYLALLVFAATAWAQRRHFPWLLCYSANIPIALHGEVLRNEYVNLNHFWSLAVEEHFYMVWPLVILYCSRSTVWKISIALFVGAIGTRVALTCGTPSLSGHGAYVLTPCRIDGLVLGAMLALLVRAKMLSEIRPWAKTSAVVAGGTIVVFFLLNLSCTPHHPLMQTVGYSIFDIFFAAVLILAIGAQNSSLWRYWWEHPVLCFFGKYSYGLYVWHYLFIEWFRQSFHVRGLVEWSGSTTIGLLAHSILGILLSTAMAVASWHLFERHFLKLRNHFTANADIAG
jgi:peptidoglycan/LPS O-acetylase OafA/YrhL